MRAGLAGLGKVCGPSRPSAVTSLARRSSQERVHHEWTLAKWFTGRCSKLMGNVVYIIVRLGKNGSATIVATVQ